MLSDWTSENISSRQDKHKWVRWGNFNILHDYVLSLWRHEAKVLTHSLPTCKGNSKAIHFSLLSLRKEDCLSPWKHLPTPKTIWYTGQFVRKLTFWGLLHQVPSSQHFPLSLWNQYNAHPAGLSLECNWEFKETDILFFFFFSADNSLSIYLMNQRDLFTKLFMDTTYLRWLTATSWLIRHLMLLMFQRRLLIPFIVWFNDCSFMCVFMSLLQAAEQLLLWGW